MEKREEELARRESELEEETKIIADRLAALQAAETTAKPDGSGGERFHCFMFAQRLNLFLALGLVMPLDAKLRVFETVLAGARQDLMVAKRRFREEVLALQTTTTQRSEDAKTLGDKLLQLQKQVSAAAT